MPWSEWITPEPSVSAGSLLGAYTDRSAYGSVADFESIDDLVNTFLSGARAGGGAINEGSTILQGSYTQNVAGGERATNARAAVSQAIYVGGISFDPLVERNYWPGDLLPDLEFGVDFTVRPDRTEDDEDAYIEYEGGLNELIGWQPWDLTFDPDSFFYSHSETGTIDIEANYRLAVDSVPAWAPGAAPASNTEDVPWLSGSDGTTVATVTFTGNNGGDTIPVHVVLPLSAETYRFTLLVQDPFMDPGYFPSLGVTPPSLPTLERGATIAGAGQLAAIDVGGNVVLGGPQYQYQMPRFRYWIPGRPPLRQRQRDDGLALGARRQSGRTSRQGTIRQRSYT